MESSNYPSARNTERFLRALITLFPPMPPEAPEVPDFRPPQIRILFSSNKDRQDAFAWGSPVVEGDPRHRDASPYPARFSDGYFLLEPGDIPRIVGDPAEFFRERNRNLYRVDHVVEEIR